MMAKRGIRYADPLLPASNQLVVPIPLRANLTVIVGIPPDLTQAEARKVGAVIQAFATAPTPPPEGKE